jgi:predicted nucleic acid-binding protein
VEVTRILADTSAYSAFFRGHSGVKALFQKVDEVVLSPVVLGELRAGFIAGAHRRKNERELDLFLRSSRVSIASVDEETSECYVAIVYGLRTAGTPIPTNDIWIAASAMQHGLRVITTDRHFAKISQILCEVLPIE